MALTRKRDTNPQEQNQTNRVLLQNLLSSKSYVILNKTLLNRYGLSAGVLLSFLLDKDRYWGWKKQDDYDGWFYFTKDRQVEEMKMGRERVQKAKKDLVQEGILKTKRMGIPAKEWFQLDYNLLMEHISEMELLPDPDIDMPEEEEDEVDNQPESCSTSHTGTRKSSHTETRNTRHTETRMTISNNRYSNNRKNKNNLSDIEKLIDKCTLLAQRLSGIIRSKKQISHSTAQIGKWGKDIHSILIHTLGDMPIDEAYQRVARLLHWYRSHIGQPYVPVIESGQSLKDKFLKLEAAMERDKGTPNPSTQAKTNPGKYSSVRKLKWGDDEDE